MKNFAFKYFIIASVTLIGMLASLYADLKLGELLSGINLDTVIRQITLLMAYDIVVREALRFSLLKVFASAETESIKKQMYKRFFSTLLMVGVIFSVLYSFLYIFLLDEFYQSNLIVINIVFLLMFISSGLQLLLNLSGNYFLYGIRVFLIPLSLISWLFYIPDQSLEFNFFVCFLIYCFVIVAVLRKKLFPFEFDGSISESVKEYFIPPAFPMVSYSFLQSARYFERSMVASVSVGSSYFIYFSFKLYASFLSLIGMPVSVLLSKILVDNGAVKSGVNIKSGLKLLYFIVGLWFLGGCVIFILYQVGFVEKEFPKLANKEFINLVMFYYLAALLGSMNLPLQSSVYKHGGHTNIMKITVVMSVVYVLVLLAGLTYIDPAEYLLFVASVFLVYVLIEFILLMLLNYLWIRKNDLSD